jgi:hypothetical protein
MIRSAASAICGTRSIAPSTTIGPASPSHAWCAVEPCMCGWYQ